MKIVSTKRNLLFIYTFFLSFTLAAQSPVENADNFVVSGYDETQLTVSWSNIADANRSGYLILANKTGTFSDPSGLVADDADLADDIGAIKVSDNATTYTWNTGLTSSTVYYFKIFPYHFDGVSTYTYLTTGPTTSRTTLAPLPTANPTGILFPTRTTNSISVNFTAATNSPDGYLAIRGHADPQDGSGNGLTDGVTYNVGDVLDGDTIVFIGTTASLPFTDNGATNVPGRSYYYDIYSYNGSGASINYRVSGGPLEGNAKTLHPQPTSASETISFSSVEGTSMTINLTLASTGGGSSRLIVAREGNTAVSFTPVDGTTYTAASYSAGTEVGTAGHNNKIVAIGTGNTFNITGLSEDKNYQFAVYEFNGSASSENYLATALTGSQQTEPLTQASAVSFTSVLNNSMRVTWTNGDGDRRLVVARQGSSVSTGPSDFTSYTADADWNNGTPLGSQIGSSDGYVVYDGTDNYVDLTNLLTNTTYYFAVYEYNGSSPSTGVFKGSGATGSRTTANIPTTQALNITFTPHATPTSNLTIDWDAGNGANRIVVVKTTDGTFTPTNGSTYNANLSFTANSNIGSTGNVRCVYNGNGSGPISVSNLSSNTTYVVQIFEYNGSAGSEQYLTTTNGTNPASRSTAHGTSPNSSGGTMSFSNVTQTSLSITLTDGNGSSMMLIARPGTGSVNFTPVDGASYSVNSDYSAATEVGTVGDGNKILAISSADDPTFNITGLSPNTRYSFAAVEFNGTAGTGAENYGATRTGAVGTEPTTDASAAYFDQLDSDQYRLNWTNGNGNIRIVLARQGSAVDDFPNDFTSFTGADQDYSQGTQVGDGYAVYSSTGSNVLVRNLTPSTVYHFNIIEGNSSNDPVSSATSVWRTPGTAVSRITLAAEPTAASTAMVFSNISGTSITVGKTSGAGTGARRLLIAREGNAVTFVPTDGTDYTANADFTNATAQDADGNKIVGKGSDATFTVTGLSSDKVYYFRFVEFNGTPGLGDENYYTTYLNGNRSTEPTNDVTSLQITAFTNNSLTLTWTNPAGSGNRKLVLAKKTNSITTHPNDLTDFTGFSNTYGSGTPVVDGAYPVESSSNSTTVTVTGLDAASVYNFRVYAGNSTASTNSSSTGSINAVWLTPGASISRTTLANEPTTQASLITFGTAGAFSITNIGWTKGNGTGGRLLLVKPLTTFTSADIPVDGSSYTYTGLDYSAGTAIGSNGSKVVYSEGGSGTGGVDKVTVTGLDPNTLYYFAVVEFNGTAGTGDENYNLNAATDNPKSRSTITNTQPSIQASNLSFTPTGTSDELNLKWTNGNGLGGRIVVINTVPITSADNPTNGVTYTGDLTYSDAPAIGTGTARVVYTEGAAGTGGLTGITIDGLSSNTTYYFKVFEFGGTASTENYQTADATANPASSTTLTEPTSTYGVTAGTLTSAEIDANITVTFNVAMRFVNDVAISTDADIKTFLHLENSATNLPVNFTSSIAGNVITIIPDDSNIPSNTMTGSRSYEVSIDASEIESTNDVVFVGSTETITAETLVEPGAQATATSSTSTTTSITLNWEDAATGQLPENYLIVGVEDGTSFPSISDGTDNTIDTDFSDGSYIQKVALGVETLTITALKSDVQYDFRIYAYTNEGAAIDYNVTSPTLFSVTTTAGSLSTVSAGSGVSTFSSLTDSKTDALAVSNANSNFSFVITDDASDNAIDNAPTRLSSFTINRDVVNDGTGDWTDVIGGIVLTDGTTTINSEDHPGSFAVAQNSITISSISNGSASDLGFVADNGTKTYYVKIWLRDNITDVDIDNKKFVFTLTSGGTDITTASANSSDFASSNTSSGVANNTALVVATKIIFTELPVSGTGAGFPFDLSVAAVDANNNVDLNESGTASTVRLGSSYLSGSPSGSISFGSESQDHDLASGRTTWNDIKVSRAGDYTFDIEDRDTSPTDLTPTNLTSSTINFGAASNESAVVESSTFTYPTNIDYRSYQQATTLVSTIGTSIKVAEFIIQDGGSDLTDPDAIGTSLTDIELTITNPGNLRLVGIHDGSGIVASQPAGNTVTFTGLSLLAEDADLGGGGTRVFSIYVSFNSTVTDNEHFEFKVTSASSSGSTFAAVDAGGATSSIDDAENNTVVSASALNFIQGATDALLQISMSPAVTIEAVDNFGSRDLDYSGTLVITSSGVLASPVSLSMTNGFVTASAIRHSTIGSNLELQANIGLLPGLTSTAFDITASQTSDIAANASFTYPEKIHYEQYQDLAITAASTGNLAVASFRIRDGGSTLSDADNAATILDDITFNIANVSALRSVAIFQGTTLIAEKAAVSPLTFNDLAISAPDNSSATFDIKVSFKNSSAFVTDTTSIQFTIASATTTTTSSAFALSTAGGAKSSLAGDDNRIDVRATKFVFTEPPSKFIYANVPFEPNALELDARDDNDIVDLEYDQDVTIINRGNIPMTDDNVNSQTTITETFVLGHLVLNSNLRYDIRGDGNGILDITDPLTNGISFSSDSIYVLVANNSDVAETNFVYPQDIEYIKYQTNNIELPSDNDEIIIAEFTLRDGGATFTDEDKVPTELTELTIDLGANHSYIKRLALYNGTIELDEKVVTGSSVTFDGFSLTAPEADSINFLIVASFNNVDIIDRNTITITVVDAKTNQDYSQFALDNAGGATTTISGNENRIQVIATQIDFTTIPDSVSIAIPFEMIAIARDIHQNTDIDFDGIADVITSFINTDNFDVANGPQPGISTFNDGIFTFAYTGDLNSSFHFTNGNDTTKFKIEAGGIKGVSPHIAVVSSFDSRLAFDSDYQFNSDVDYHLYQVADITNTLGESFEISRFVVHDGDPTSPYEGGTKRDLDGAPTILKDVQITLSTSLSKLPVRSIALYAGSTEIIEKSPTPLVNGKSVISFEDVDIVANDEADAEVSVRVTFMDDADHITDNDEITLHITSATASDGSQFIPTTGYIGGVMDGLITPDNVNKVEVTATQFVFTEEPPAIAGINQPVPLSGNKPQVQAQDDFGILDLDFNSTNFVITSVNETTTPSLPVATITNLPDQFENGVLDFDNFRYTKVGVGTLKIEDSGSSPAISADVSSHVDVIHVYAKLADKGVHKGSLAPGSEKRPIFGLTFDSDYTIPDSTLLKGFKIDFETLGTIPGVFNSVKIYESTDNAFQISDDKDITSSGTDGINGVVTVENQSIIVDLSVNPRDIHTQGPLSYFLVVNVEKSTNAGTPIVKPIFEDGGYDDPTTNDNTTTEHGSSSTGLIEGLEYNFAAILAPTLVSSFPASGQLNVDPTQPVVELVFSVPVWTLDGKINLRDYNTGALVETLLAKNGHYDNADIDSLAGTEEKPLKFLITETLLPDHMYYIEIPPASVQDNIGIIDQSKNESLGFSYSGTLYFKTFNANAPRLLLSANTGVTSVESTGAIVNGVFNQTGKAYFMVVDGSNTSTPDTAQIKGSTFYAGAISRGSFNINQIDPISQSGSINVADSLRKNVNYQLWMYAESYSSRKGLNDTIPVLTPFRTFGPYGDEDSGYLAGQPGPTFSFSLSERSTEIRVNAPTIRLCGNSYQVINTPIVVSEGDLDDFYASDDTVTFNLLLPSGYQFDDSDIDGVPVYGIVTLVGSDFVQGSQSISFINNSIVQIRYRNSGTSSLDKIVISNLRMLGSGTARNGTLKRLGGDAITNAIKDNHPFAFLEVRDVEPVTFTNSYTNDYFLRNPEEVETPVDENGDGIADNQVIYTIIPDDFNQNNGGTVELIPQHPIGDYGSSSFSGTGVNINMLSLSSVTLNIPFNITITHTDNNGCITQNAVQYSVYDHDDAMDGLATKYCAATPGFGILADLNSQNDTIRFDNNLQKNPASRMKSLSARIAPYTENGTVPPFNSSEDSTQWAEIITALPVMYSDTVIGSNTYQSYYFDPAHIANAQLSMDSSFFRRRTLAGNYYYTGGSLGKIEFKGIFQSITNLQLEFPKTQNVEFYIPAIPIIEVGLTNASAIDVNDPLNEVPQNPHPYDPVKSNKGTIVFCEKGGIINITGYPQAAPGISVGRFTLMNASDSTMIYDGLDKTPGGFTDNHNGTATLNPDSIKNDYGDIWVIYHYQDNNSPCESEAKQMIRITPNPEALFALPEIACVGEPLHFDGQESENNFNQNFDIASWHWNFGDPLNSSSSNPNEPKPDLTEKYIQASHIFADTTSYTISLYVTSEYGCESGLTTMPLHVGIAPDIRFDVAGVSTADNISFNPGGTKIWSEDNYDSLIWNFGDGQQSIIQAKETVTHQYDTAGIYDISVRIRTEIGCEASASTTIVVVPFIEANSENTYLESFEITNGKDNGAGWQTYSINDTTSSWTYGFANKAKMKMSPQNNQRVWATGVTSNYNAKEESALYSPSFDLSALERPMISFDRFTSFPTSDGVVLQYSDDDYNIADSRKTWKVLGNDESGLNWYTHEDISSQPGGQVNPLFGWSGSNGTWTESKHTLDVADLDKTKRLVFRFALASSSLSPDSAGFALDNVRIGNRTRIVLIENFTNSGYASNIEQSETERVDQYLLENTGTQVIKINYHTSFPAQDPFNADNMLEASARALYYNIASTPLVRIDGKNSVDAFQQANPRANVTNMVEQQFSEWGDNWFKVQSLKLAQATIDINATLAGDGILTVNTNITASNTDLPEATRIFIAVIEESIAKGDLPAEKQELIKTQQTHFNNTFKNFIPSASGVKFGSVLLNNASREFGPFSWHTNEMNFYSDTITLIVFLQNEDTKEVYQTESKRIARPSIITSIEPESSPPFHVYPSPADRELTIQLPESARQRTAIELYDQLGKQVGTTWFEKGESVKSIEIRNYAPGMYLIQIPSEKGVLRRKVLIVHRN